MANIDSEDELKRRMRRRLVGAVALVTAIVVILPMLLESRPKPTQGSLDLRIPDKDGVGRFTSQTVVAESAPEITPEFPGEAPSVASAPVVPPAPQKPAKPTPAAPVKPSSAQKSPAKSAHQAAGNEPATGAQRQPAESAHAPKAGFAVQVGAFANLDKAKDLLKKLRADGWHAYTEQAGEATRVRVGPYTSREAAEKALHKLEAQGMKPAVVTEP